MSVSDRSGFRCLFLLCIALSLSACAGVGGSDLKPGVSGLSDVIASMGAPAMRWKDADGREQLAYPRGPAATQTFMVFVGPDGRLERIEKALNMENFSRIQSGKSDMAVVLRLLGPVPPQNVTYFKARDELVWSWLFCDSWKTSRLSLTSCSMVPPVSCERPSNDRTTAVGMVSCRRAAVERRACRNDPRAQPAARWPG